MILRLVVPVIVSLFLMSCRHSNRMPVSRLAIIEGERATINHSKMDIFPDIITDVRETMGGVSIGAHSVEGFCRINMGQRVIVDWAEGRWNGPRHQAYFTIPEGDYSSVRSVEFVYTGNDVWTLNLYDKLFSEEGRLPLCSVIGIVETATSQE